MVPWFQAELPSLLATYGYGAIAVVVALESMGIPLPGEMALVSAAIYAGATHKMNIVGVIAAASTGAVIGDNIGYWLGREIGYGLLVRYGRYVRLSESKVKLGRYLFRLHGAKIVFLGRFVAFLRVLAAFLAGVNRMDWSRFFVFNVAGGVTWASVFGVGGYAFGAQFHRFLGPVGTVSLIAGVTGIVAMALFVRRHEARLQAEAEIAFPGTILDPAERGMVAGPNEPLRPRR
jgi:membrane protein DedA with SNARE-associated domain